MNAGWKHANTSCKGGSCCCRWFLFLHSDSCLPPGYLDLMEAAVMGGKGGADGVSHTIAGMATAGARRATVPRPSWGCFKTIQTEVGRKGACFALLRVSSQTAPHKALLACRAPHVHAHSWPAVQRGLRRSVLLSLPYCHLQWVYCVPACAVL